MVNHKKILNRIEKTDNLFHLIPVEIIEKISRYLEDEDIINWTKSYTNIKNIYFSLNNFYTFEDYNKMQIIF